MAGKITEHTITYNMPISAGKGVLMNRETPKNMAFFDRIVLFSRDIHADEIDKGKFSFKSETKDVLPADTSAQFFRKTEYMSTQECGFVLDFDVEAKGTLFSLEFNGDDALSGTLSVMIFYRDSPYPNPRVK